MAVSISTCKVALAASFYEPLLWRDNSIKFLSFIIHASLATPPTCLSVRLSVCPRVCCCDCKPGYFHIFGRFRPIAKITYQPHNNSHNSDLQPHNNSYNSDLQPHNNSYNSDMNKTLFKLNAIFVIALYIRYKLRGDR